MKDVSVQQVNISAAGVPGGSPDLPVPSADHHYGGGFWLMRQQTLGQNQQQ